MKLRCKAIVRVNDRGWMFTCRQPAKKLGGTARCADHWPAVVS